MAKSKKTTKKRKNRENSKKWNKLIEMNNIVLKKFKSFFSKIKL